MEQCRYVVTAAVIVAALGIAWAGTCPVNTGSNLKGATVGGLSGVPNWGNVGGINAYSFSTNVCNVGTAIEPVEALTNGHPVIAINMFRLLDGRFEQIGMSWVKHMFGAATSNYCCPCQDPGDIAILGVGCADSYGASTNGLQAGFDGMAGLGPRSDINPVTGLFPFPYTTQGQAGNAIHKRLQVHDEDLDPSLNAGALYFGETQYVGPQDCAAGNQQNNAAYRPLLVDGFADGGWQMSLDDVTRPGVAAIHAWQEFVPSVTLREIDVPDDGRFILGSNCTDNGDGTWHYEYALHNLFSHRAAGRFSIPLGSGVTISSTAFHDVDSHSGEIYDSTDWAAACDDLALAWSTASFAANENANALRWGTMYNFRFDADRAPGTVTATVGLFRPGAPDEVTVPVCGPAPTSSGDVTGDDAVNVNDLVTVIAAWGPCPPCPVSCPADTNGDGVVGVDDLVAVVRNWSG